MITCMQSGLHHAHKRKREEVTAENHWAKKAILDGLAYPVGFISALFNLPQLIDVWSKHDVGGLSIVSWTGFTLASLFWLYYAVIHKEKSLIVTFGLTLTFQLLIVVGIIVYK